ncbi:MAG: acyl--CoA ligase [Candidatus Schekmanbacteria bacterium]|nr:acyl--CoA ligase [Candidatus Schekmanbacteria bacterium]
MIYTIGEIITQTSLKTPDKTALIFDGQRYSYRELERKINQCARKLIGQGIAKGEKAALFITNAPEFIIAYFALIRIGAVVVPVNTQLKLRELQYILENCQTRMLLTNLATDSFINQTLPHLTTVQQAIVLTTDPKIAGDGRIQFWNLQTEEGANDHPGLSLIDADEAVIIYTSGTTGQPKGVVLTHLNILSNVNSIVHYLRLTEDDNTLIFLPLFYSYALSQMLTVLRAGGTITLMRDFLFPQRALSLVGQEGVTGFGGVPTTYNILLRIGNLPTYNLSSLRYILNAGGPIYPAIIERLLSAFPGVEIINNYGCSEVAPRATYLDFKYAREKIGSIGKAIPNVQVRVLNPDGREVVPGETGEIVIRGSNVMKGYLNNPVETGRVLQKDGLHTGDMATIDEDGFIFIKGRKSDIINCRGEKISAKEVEAVLISHPAVYEAAVVGMPDEILGEAVKAYIVSKDGQLVNKEELLIFCARNLASYKVPKVVEFVAQLPKTASGKVQKHLLK